MQYQFQMPIRGFSDYNNGNDNRRSERLPDGVPLNEPPKFLEVVFPGFDFRSVTFILSTTQLAIFIVTCFMGTLSPGIAISSDVLIRAGGNVPSKLKEGEVWRLILPIFLHANISHVFINLFVQMQMSFKVEKHLGPIVFTSFYFLCGIVGSVVSAGCHGSEYNGVSVGASGSIFGVLAMRFCKTLLQRHLSEMHQMKFCYSLINLVLMVLILSLFSGIDHYAHLGGFVTGFTLLMTYPKNDWTLPNWHSTWKYICLGIFALVVGGSVGGLFLH